MVYGFHNLLDHVYLASCAVKKISDSLSNCLLAIGVNCPPLSLYELACRSEITCMIQDVSHLSPGDTLQGHDLALFQRAEELNRKVLSRIGRKGGRTTWNRMVDSLGTGGALCVLKDRGFGHPVNCAKGGKASMAVHGVNDQGQSVAAVRTGLARQHDIRFLTSLTDRFHGAVRLAHGLMDIRTSFGEQEQVLVGCLIDALPAGLSVHAFDFCTSAEKNYKRSFLGMSLSIEVLPLSARP
mmetsp:Transcript_36765/g.82709  ORF Transcript_36765/g.82709 Transcript_36765/m.82709 type:complete len:240 (-) Transcript_36765:395-1114(-)